MTMKIQIINQTSRRIPARWLLPLLRKAARLSGVKDGQWVITLVADRAMKALHKRSMNLSSTTDVLTFDLRDSERDAFDLDTVICADEAQRRADELNHSLREEILLYAIHSLLHLCGYDDLTPREYQKMHAREDEILVKLGVGRVFLETGAAKKTRKTKRQTRNKGQSMRT